MDFERVNCNWKHVNLDTPSSSLFILKEDEHVAKVGCIWMKIRNHVGGGWKYSSKQAYDFF